MNRMKRYEYLIESFVSIHRPKEMTSVCRALTSLGRDGWELVAVVPMQGNHSEESLFYFKREKPN
jgi:hypothetical protein